MDAPRRSRHLRLAKARAREALVRLVGEACRFDDLIADLIHELRGRPYDLTLVAGGYALRTKTRFAPAIRAAHPGLGRDDVAELTRTETFALTAIAYLQPVTRGEISKLAGREISRDIIAALKRHGLIDGAIRAPQPGAPFAYVTTRKFLEVFGFATLRDLPDLERLKAEGSLWTRRTTISTTPLRFAECTGMRYSTSPNHDAETS